MNADEIERPANVDIFIRWGKQTYKWVGDDLRYGDCMYSCMTPNALLESHERGVKYGDVRRLFGVYFHCNHVERFLTFAPVVRWTVPDVTPELKTLLKSKLT